MENSKENKFVCNFCHKSFTCGKSLGGHIRIHKNEKSSRVAEKQRERSLKFQVPTERRRSKRDLESEVGNGNSGYGLRENPKITRRFADSGYSSRQEKFCRECGQGFQSSEALSWHLACHSGNERENRRLQYNYGITHQKREFIEENQSDIPERVREAAMCLMMMSKAPRFSGLEGLNSAAESSDSKSSSRHFRESDTSASYSNGGLEMREVTGRINKLEVSEFDGENSDSDNFRKEICKKVKLKLSVHRALLDEEYKKPDFKFGVRVGRASADILKNSMKTKKNDDQVHASYKYELRKRLKNGSYSPDLWEGSSKKMPSENFRSHDRETYTRMSNGCEWTHQSGENSVNTTTNSISIPSRELIESSNGKNKGHQDTSGNEEKKLGPKRKHKCPICFKAFKSGQALGGHKRSHVVGSLEDASIVTRQESNGITGLIDLNVPAPMEEEESGRWD